MDIMTNKQKTSTLIGLELYEQQILHKSCLKNYYHIINVQFNDNLEHVDHTHILVPSFVIFLSVYMFHIFVIFAYFLLRCCIFLVSQGFRHLPAFN